MKTRMWLLLIAVALFAMPCFAQFNMEREISPEDSGGAWSGSTSYSNGQYLDNPCTAVQDFVWVDFSAYVNGLQPEEGVDRYQLAETTTMSGTMYSASGSSQADVAYSPAFSVRQYHKVNTYDNFHVVTVLTFNPMYKTTTVSVETACGNGMPDSPQ
jgi:hypothetical protein